jgi:hypothetical protein
VVLLRSGSGTNTSTMAARGSQQGSIKSGATVATRDVGPKFGAAQHISDLGGAGLTLDWERWVELCSSQLLPPPRPSSRLATTPQSDLGFPRQIIDLSFRSWCPLSDGP